MNSSNNISDFLYVRKDWFTRAYADKLDHRFPTMKAALNLFYQRGGETIVETGCQRLVDDWGAGCSTQLFAEVIRHHGGQLHSVDNDRTHLDTARRIVGDQQVSFYLQDSVAFLMNFGGPIDLLYLDSYDYPYFELLDIYGGRHSTEAIMALDGLEEEEIVERHGDLIIPCQEHCLRELTAARDKLHDRSVILIDDNNFPGGGKPRLAREYLKDRGWEVILDYQQTLWTKKQ